MPFVDGTKESFPIDHNMEKKKPTPLFSAIPLQGIEVRSRGSVRVPLGRGRKGSRSLIQKAAPLEGRRPSSGPPFKQAEGDTARKRGMLRCSWSGVADDRTKNDNVKFH